MAKTSLLGKQQKGDLKGKVAQAERGTDLGMMLLLFSRSVVSDSFQPHGLQQARLPCPSPSPGYSSNSCALSQRCHPAISSSVIPFSSLLQSFPASGTFLMSQFFISGDQSIGASASVLPMNIQGWFPLGLTNLILQFKGLSRVFTSIMAQKHQFFGAQPSLWSNAHIHNDYWKNHRFDNMDLCWEWWGMGIFKTGLLCIHLGGCRLTILIDKLRNNRLYCACLSHNLL